MFRVRVGPRRLPEPPHIAQTADIAIVGAGPYGLSVAAHLRARGADYRIFGRPLETWRERMPRGMLLKSDGFASNLSAPCPGAALADHCAERGLAYDPTDIAVPLDTFIDYGLAFQQRQVPDLDPRQVAAVAPAGRGGWRLRLDDGETLEARNVVLAVGIAHFAETPAALAGLPADLVTHASAHREVSRFAGRDVAVIGAGSSAVELAVALGEAGARPRLIARRDPLRFASPPGDRRRSPWSRLRHPSSGLGPGLRSRLSCDAPDLFRVLPGPARLEIVRRHLGPSSPWWLKSRLNACAEVIGGRAIAGAQAAGGKVRLHLTAGPDGRDAEIAVDHVICATGYRADVGRLGFLDPEVRAGLHTVGGAPVLTPWFESSAHGLYFTGLASAATFGPLMRFMHGDAFAARRISGHLGRRTA